MIDTLRSSAHLQKEIGNELFLALVSSDNTEAVRRFAESLVRGKQPLKKCTVIVDYGEVVVEKMISAGHYDWHNNIINSHNFPLSGDGVFSVNLELVHLNKRVRSEDVLSYLEAKGLRPATLAELLAFGASYTEIQREFPIVCLGSSCVRPRGGRCVPCLGGGGSRRELCLDWFDGVWDGFCRFLAVRK